MQDGACTRVIWVRGCEGGECGGVFVKVREGNTGRICG